MRIPGDVARKLCRQLVAQWGDEPREELEVTVEGTDPGCFITASRVLDDNGIRPMVGKGRRKGSVKAPFAVSSRRFGTGLPVVLEGNRQRRMVADIAAELKQRVEQAHNQPWP